MKNLIYLLLFISVVLTSCSGTIKPAAEENKQPYLIILSLDGFRWDYCSKANTPTFDSLTKAGAKAESLKPSFPTKTFPNHYSIATGLYPDHHGIVLNDFWASDLQLPYAIRNKKAVTNGDFYDGQPMWNVVEDNDIISATLFWVGASADIDKKQSSHWSKYFPDLSLDARIDSVSNWLQLPEKERPHLIMWYYLEPDLTGHIYGPDSKEIVTEIENLDTFVGNFFTEMRKLPNYDDLNFIILSDHGMAQLSPDKVIWLDDYIDTNDLAFWNGSNPVLNLKAKPGKIDKVYQDLENKHPNLHVWKHGEVPEHLHYGTHIRTQDITIASDSGWSIYWSWKPGKSLGTHGFNNECKNMHAIFYAAGPAFKTNYTHPTFNNVDIYPLVGSILNIEMPASDGKLENVEGLLK